MIRVWCLSNEMPPPPGKPLESFVSQIQHPKADRLPTLHWDSCVIYCYRQHLWLRHARAKPCSEQITYDSAWDGQSHLVLPFELGTLRLDLAKLEGFQDTQTSKPPIFRVTSRQADEKIQCRSTQEFQRTKRLLAEAHIPPWERDLWPRIWLGEELLACGARWQSPKLNNALSWDTGCFGAQPNGSVIG